MTKKIFIALVSMWWAATALIDFAVVPTVFSTVSEFFNAGELAIALFFKLNKFELVVSSLLIIFALLNLRSEGRGKTQLILTCCAWMIVMFYFSYLTPKITTLTTLWRETELTNKIGIADINDIQQEHQFYHRMYVGLDSLKFLFLTFILGFSIFRKELKIAKA